MIVKLQGGLVMLLSNASADFVNFMHEFSFYCIVNTATYFSPIKLDETSCLDHVWHNLLYKTQTFVISPSIADHLSVASFIDYPIPDTKKTAYFRCFNKRNVDVFLNNIQYELEHLCVNVSDGGSVLDCLTQITNKYFPVKSKTVTAKRINAPWITPQIMRCINKKHYWLKLLKRRVIFYSSFKSYCSLLNKLLRVAEKSYYQSKFDSIGSNSKKNWKLLNNFLGNNTAAENKPTRILLDGNSLSDP